MTLKAYIPALIVLLMVTATFIVPWIVGWVEIVRRVWG